MAEEVPVSLTSQEWEVIVVLVGTGEVECPWAWSNDWPKDIDGDEAERIATKFRERFRAADKLTQSRD